MTQGNNRISEKSPSEVPVLIKWEKPEEQRADTNALPRWPDAVHEADPAGQGVKLGGPSSVGARTKLRP